MLDRRQHYLGLRILTWICVGIQMNSPCQSGIQCGRRVAVFFFGHQVKVEAVPVRLLFSCSEQLIFQTLVEHSVFCSLTWWALFRIYGLGFYGTLFQNTGWWYGESSRRWSHCWLLAGEPNVVRVIGRDWVVFQNRVRVILLYLIAMVRSMKSHFKKWPQKFHSSSYHSCMVSWKYRSSAASRSLSYILHIPSTPSINILQISKVFQNVLGRKNPTAPYKTVAYVGAGGVNIAVPLRWSQCLSPKRKILFIVIRQRFLSIALTGRCRYFLNCHFNIVLSGSMQDKLGYFLCIYWLGLPLVAWFQVVCTLLLVVLSRPLNPWSSLAYKPLLSGTYCQSIHQMGCIKMPVHEMMGLMANGVLCILILPKTWKITVTLVLWND